MFIDCEAGEIICLVASVCQFFCVSVCALLLELFDTGNTVQHLCVFVSNQGAFAIKSLTAVDYI